MAGMLGIFAVNALLLAVLAYRVRAISRVAAVLREEAEALRSAPYDAPAELDRLSASAQRPLIVIDILNALELAAQQSWFADKFGSLAPEGIRRLVFKRALEMTELELLKHGVKGQVRIHRGA